MPSTNEIFASNTSKMFIGRRTFKAEDGDPSQEFILIEGDAETFKFLGSLFTAMANPEEDCSRTIHPKGAGQVHFSQGSALGLMLHRNDCIHGSKRHPTRNPLLEATEDE